MNDERLTKIKNLVSAIVSPFATASLILLIILSFLEYLRHGFVSLFLDLRIVVAAALVLWCVAVVTEDRPKRRRLALVLPSLALLAVLPVLYRMTVPFGRLGLVVFGAGAAGIILIILTITSVGGEHGQ